MAEYVQLKFEEKIPLLTSLFHSKLVSVNEIKSYKIDIYNLFQKCQRPARTLNDYYKLIDRERTLLEVLEVRRKENGYHDKKEDLEEKIKNDISKYFGWAKMFFKQDIDLLLHEINVYEVFEWSTKLKQTIQEALPIHGSKSPALWIRATQYEIKYSSGKNVQDLFIRALRQHKSFERVYLEYLYYEWSCIDKKLNNETDEEKRKKEIKNGFDIGLSVYTKAKEECDTKGGTFFLHFLSVADRFEFTQDFKDYVIRDIDMDQNKDHKTLKLISLYKIQKTNNLSDIIKRFNDQIETKSVEVPYETLLDIICESFTLRGSFVSTIDNKTIDYIFMLCNKAAENKLLNEECFLNWIKLILLLKKLYGLKGLEKIGSNYKSYETIMKLFYSQWPKNFYAASEYTIGKICQDVKLSTCEYRIVKILEILESNEEYQENDKKLVESIKCFFTSLCVRLPLMNPRAEAKPNQCLDFFFDNFPYRKFPMVCDMMLSKYIDYICIYKSGLEKDLTTSAGVDMKKLKVLYKKQKEKFGHESFKSMIRFEESVSTSTTTQSVCLDDDKSTKDTNEGKNKSLDQIQLSNHDLSKTTKIFDDWTNKYGNSHIEPWIEYLRFIQQHENYYTSSNKYHEVYSNAQKNIKSSLTQSFFIEEMKLHEQKQNGHHSENEGYNMMEF